MAKTIEIEKIEILDLISKKSIKVTFEQLVTVAREVLCVPAIVARLLKEYFLSQVVHSKTGGVP